MRGHVGSQAVAYLVRPKDRALKLDGPYKNTVVIRTPLSAVTLGLTPTAKIDYRVPIVSLVVLLCVYFPSSCFKYLNKWLYRIRQFCCRFCLLFQQYLIIYRHYSLFK